MNPVLVYVSMMFWHWLFFWQFIVYMFAGWLWAMGYGWLLVLFVVYYLTRRFYFDSDLHISGRGVWPTFMKSWMVDYAIAWFPIRLVRTQELSWKKQYLFAVHPHGVMPWSIFPIGKSRQWGELFPGIVVRALSASVVFHIPVVREAALWTGAVDASAFNAKKVLSSGSSLAVIPGGSAELLESQPGTNVLVLKNRKGFIRLALQFGCDLVPVYAFGANELYQQIRCGKQCRQRWLKKTQIAFTFAWGRSFFNLLPKRVPVWIVVGRPLPVEKKEDASQEEVDQLHERYLNHLRALFEEYKGKYGYEDAQLTIL
ncbi:Diacylglycerol O-acyltransferase 2 [Balamuthia mandrillaris]